MRWLVCGLVGLSGCGEGNDELAARVDTLASDVAAGDARVASLEEELAASEVRIEALEQELGALGDAQPSGEVAFLGANDGTWAFPLGNAVNYNEHEVDDAEAAQGSVLVGEGAMVATSFSSTLAPGLWEASLTANWGIGIQEEAITQDVSLACDGADPVFSRAARLVAGDADDQGVNVAHEFTARLFLRTSAEGPVSCTLATRVIDVARTGDGVLYNNLNGPSLARIVRLAD